MPLKIIGTGFGRTGTESMREALNILGLGPCHHMRELSGNEAQTRLWRALAKGAAPDWETVFDGYVSAVDWPSAFFWPELIDVYPDAKVLLTWRTPESWWASFEKTILVAINRPGSEDTVGRLIVVDRVFEGKAIDRATAIAIYEENVARVKATVPAERLLVHSLGDGWAPLCAFLGVPVPDQPYPSTNSTQDFRDRMERRNQPAKS